MGEHFTDEQIAEWVAGERVPEREEHIQGCPACRCQIEEFQAALAGFGASMRSWSDRQYLAAAETGVKARAGSRPATQSSLYGAVAIAAALCVLMVLAVFHGAQGRRGVLIDTHSGVTDAVLLRQIDTEVSQTVPRAMQPLTELVSWDSSSDDRSHSKRSEKRAE
jgi:anti-sigma factor RsiW